MNIHKQATSSDRLICENQGLEFHIVKFYEYEKGVKLNVLLNTSFCTVSVLFAEKEKISIMKDLNGSTYPYLGKHLDSEKTEGYGEFVALNKRNTKKFKKELLPIIEDWYKNGGKEEVENFFDIEIP